VGLADRPLAVAGNRIAAFPAPGPLAAPVALWCYCLSTAPGTWRRALDAELSSFPWEPRPKLYEAYQMSATFDTVAGIIAETCDIPREKITPESHAINDLGIDSLDFLDVAFAIDKAFGIKMPLEQWTQEVNEGKVSSDAYFVLGGLCENIDKLVAAKGA